MPPDSSVVESPIFNFVSYKIDKIDLDLYPSLNLVEQFPMDKEWTYTISFRVPEFIKSRNEYLVGFTITLKEVVKQEKGDGDVEEVNLIVIKCGILGVFGVKEQRVSEEIEKKMVTQHFPTILFPYVRACLTGVLASGGYGSLVFPLINMNAMAEEHLRTYSISVRD